MKSTVYTMTLALPDTFSFSQSSLQAFADCPRRFWLAYVEQLPWPAVEAAPVQQHEQLMRQGATFHRLVERTEIGLEPSRVGAELSPPLDAWYDAYLRFRPADLPTGYVEIEKVLSVGLHLPAKEQALEKSAATTSPVRIQPPATSLQSSSVRLVAKYDLIAAERDGQVIIVDWKTAKRRADPATLRYRLQSTVYPYVLVAASEHLPWGPIRPEQVEMRYWFTAAPSQTIVFRYDAAQHAANRQRLVDLVATILDCESEADFPKVSDTPANRRHHCAFCIYRSRCGRGEAAGNLDDLDDVSDYFVGDIEKALAFTLDEVEELAF